MCVCVVCVCIYNTIVCLSIFYACSVGSKSLETTLKLWDFFPFNPANKIKFKTENKYLVFCAISRTLNKFCSFTFDMTVYTIVLEDALLFN